MMSCEPRNISLLCSLTYIARVGNEQVPVTLGMLILHPVICLVNEAVRSAEITLLSFAVITLALLGFSGYSLSQPEFSGHALTSFEFCGHCTSLIRISRSAQGEAHFVKVAGTTTQPESITIILYLAHYARNIQKAWATPKVRYTRGESPARCHC